MEKYYLSVLAAVFLNIKKKLETHWCAINTVAIRMSSFLTHWGRVMHICVCKKAIIVSDNGLSPGWRQVIIWTNSGIFLYGILGTNFSEILCETHTFSFKKMHLDISSAKWLHFCVSASMCFATVCNLQTIIYYINSIGPVAWYISHT